MCGIAGTIGKQNHADRGDSRQLITRMCDAIHHRGPDDWGYHLDQFEDSQVAIGMRRLSIIDVATGHQPISNEDETVWIVFNGEIYNHHELRSDLLARGHRFATRSDTETIIHLYEEEGERCVEKLRGMFGIAIWDSRNRSLFLARDRAGKKPLHYAMIGKTLVFGSEIKSLLQHPMVERRVNLEAISDFVSFGYVPDPATAFQGIQKLPPGHTLTYKDGRVSLKQYWDFSYTAESEVRAGLDENEYLERLRELIAESVKIRLESEVPLGAFLSGGIDSSTVVAMMARQMTQPVKTFSIGFKEESFDELEYARVTARKYGTDHHEFIVTPDICKIIEEVVWHHDEPFNDVSSIPTYVVSKMAREFVTVVLSGDGGDELFGGYERYAIERNRDKYLAVPRFIRHGVMKPIGAALPQGFYGKRFIGNISLDAGPRYVDSMAYLNEEAKRSVLSGAARQSLNGYNAVEAFERIYHTPSSTSNLHRQMYLDSKTYLPGDILVKVDRMSMAHSIETRAPLLDHKLIEFVQTIPPSLKLRGMETKYILKRAVKGLIPDEIITRPKRGFDVPIREWLKNDLREMLDDTVNSRRISERGYFEPATIARIMDEHLRGVRDHARYLWGLMTLELWHRAFIDRKPESHFTGAKTMQLDQMKFVMASK
jgi:asparagine synthase (glutamine-hydrolysing)